MVCCWGGELKGEKLEVIKSGNWLLTKVVKGLCEWNLKQFSTTIEYAQDIRPVRDGVFFCPVRNLQMNKDNEEGGNRQ